MHPVARPLLVTLLLPLVALAKDAQAPKFVLLPGGEFTSVLAYEDTGGRMKVAPFELQQRPVTNAQFLAFVSKHPAWRQGGAPRVFAESRYLSHWEAPLVLGKDALADQPVVNVSWFAATAYCESIGARLPTWAEWEYASAADETRNDARQDPAWKERILSWYSRPSNTALPRVGQSAANAYGIQDLHGLVWEWVEDFASMMVSSDSRKQGDPDRMRFCGAGALSMNDRDNYAVLMRTAMLSALGARDVTANLGFRCARDASKGRR